MNDWQKAIQKAFDFHPFGFEKVQQYDDWLMGPTFIVKVPMTDEEYAFNTLASVYAQDPNWQVKFTKLVQECKNATQEIKLDGSKHKSKPACTFRLFTDEPDAAYPLELGFPLVALAKKLGINRWMTHPGGNNVMVFGYKGDDLLGVFAGRRVLLDHIIEDEA